MKGRGNIIILNKRDHLDAWAREQGLNEAMEDILTMSADNIDRLMSENWPPIMGMYLSLLNLMLCARFADMPGNVLRQWMQDNIDQAWSASGQVHEKAVEDSKRIVTPH